MKRWTDADVATLKQMKLLGHSIEVIAERLGRTRSAVRQRLERRDRYSLGRTCSECPSPIFNGNASGKCRTCCNPLRRPEVEAKRLAACKAKYASDPFYRVRVQENMRRVALEAAQNPEIQAARRERGKWLYANKLDTDEVRAKIAATRPAVGEKLRAQKLAWLPPEYWPDYMFLLKKKRLKAAQAKQVILAQVEADKERKRLEAERLSPFERQMRALENGAPLIANDQKPSLANPGYYGEVA